MELTALVPSGEQTPAGRILSDGFRRLRFADERLEQEFRNVLGRQRITVLSYALVAAMGVTAALAWLDWQALPPQSAAWTLLIRIGLMLLPPALALFAAHSHRLRGELGLFVVLALLGLGLGSIAVDAIAETSTGSAGYPALAIVLLFGYLFLGLRLAQSLPINLALTVIHLLALWNSGAAAGQLADGALFLGLANLAGAGGSYLLEHAWRTDYLKSLMINYLAERDGLTGVYNRTMLDHYVQRIWRQSIKDKALLVMMLVDIDCFREYNEHYGLAAGDQVLCKLAGAITAAARRPLDFVARHTGRGFAIVLFNPDRAYGQELPERIRSNVAALAIPHAGSSIARTVTVSIGVGVTVPSERQTLDAFIELADEALAQAKSRGRDRIVALESQDTLAQTGMFDAELITPSRQRS